MKWTLMGAFIIATFFGTIFCATQIYGFFAKYNLELTNLVSGFIWFLVISWVLGKMIKDVLIMSGRIL